MHFRDRKVCVPELKSDRKLPDPGWLKKQKFKHKSWMIKLTEMNENYKNRYNMELSPNESTDPLKMELHSKKLDNLWGDFMDEISNWKTKVNFSPQCARGLYGASI